MLLISEVFPACPVMFAAARGDLPDRAGFAAGDSVAMLFFASKPMPEKAFRSIRKDPLLAQRHRPRESQPPSRTPYSQQGLAMTPAARATKLKLLQGELKPKPKTRSRPPGAHGPEATISRDADWGSSTLRAALCSVVGLSKEASIASTTCSGTA